MLRKLSYNLPSSIQFNGSYHRKIHEILFKCQKSNIFPVNTSLIIISQDDIVGANSSFGGKGPVSRPVLAPVTVDI